MVVRFDPKQLPFARLLEVARKFQCASQLFSRDPAQVRLARKHDLKVVARYDLKRLRVDDLKYHLSRSRLRHLPMTELQALRINALVAHHKPWKALLSPRQLAWLERIEKERQKRWPSAIGVPMAKAVDAIRARLR